MTLESIHNTVVFSNWMNITPSTHNSFLLRMRAHGTMYRGLGSHTNMTKAIFFIRWKKYSSAYYLRDDSKCLWMKSIVMISHPRVYVAKVGSCFWRGRVEGMSLQTDSWFTAVSLFEVFQWGTWEMKENL